jgi:hypothetical protein
MAMTGVGSENELTGADVREPKTLSGENASQREKLLVCRRRRPQKQKAPVSRGGA